jgi:hypothetical protein
MGLVDDGRASAEGVHGEQPGAGPAANVSDRTGTGSRFAGFWVM